VTAPAVDYAGVDYDGVEVVVCLPEADPGEPGRYEIDQRKRQLRVSAIAAAELLAESAPPMPASCRGDTFLAQPDDEPAYRIDGLWPAGGNVVIAAQFKAGKTTLRDNLIRSLCDGMPFLSRYGVTPLPGQLVVLDCEMPARTARRWLSAQMITHAERFTYMNLRGATASFNILVPQVLDTWAKVLAETGASTLILDCIGPVLAAVGLDENKASDVGRFLAAFEQMLAQAGINESFVIHHMGHDAERSRGASRLRDWPDAEWRLVRLDDRPSSPRYLSAYGRDVDMPESRLDYDPDTRNLTVGGGSRRSEKQDAAQAAILVLLGQQSGLSGRAIENALGGEHTQKAIRDALHGLISDAAVMITQGPRNSRLHSLKAG
jgi:AAA domain